MPRNKKEQHQEEIMYALHGGTSSPDPYSELIAAALERERNLDELRVRSYVRKLKQPYRLAVQLAFGLGRHKPHTVRQAAERMGMSPTHAQRLRSEALEQLRLLYRASAPAPRPNLHLIRGGTAQRAVNEVDDAA